MCLPFPDLDERRLEKGVLHGFEYEIVKNRYGYRCGYVKVGPEHPWFGKGYDDVSVEVHGGLTFADHGKACPTHGEEAEWWVGFDCSHGFDAPDPLLVGKDERSQRAYAIMAGVGDGLHERLSFMRPTVKDDAYVRAECDSLAQQAAAAAAA